MAVFDFLQPTRAVDFLPADLNVNNFTTPIDRSNFREGALSMILFSANIPAGAVIDIETELETAPDIGFANPQIVENSLKTQNLGATGALPFIGNWTALVPVGCVGAGDQFIRTRWTFRGSGYANAGFALTYMLLTENPVNLGIQADQLTP